MLERYPPFAVFTRYPGLAPPTSREEYQEALALAEAVVCWAEERLRSEQNER